MAVPPAQQRAVKKYQNSHYEFVKVRFNKGERQIVMDKAKAAGKSMNQYITDILLDK